MRSLRSQLQAAMEPRQIFHAQVWGNPRAMSEALRDVRKTLGDADGGKPSSDVLQASLKRFASTQQVGSFTELKYVCYGVTVPISGRSQRLIDNAPLFDSLLGLVELQGDKPKQYRRCYQGLLNGYFGFDKQTEATSAGGDNWQRLRGYLDQRLVVVQQAALRRGVVPEWLTALHDHRNLLSDDPCGRYARDLRQGNSDDLRALCGTLGIASTSWVWDEALMAYVRAVCDNEDREFQRDLGGVLSLVNGQSDMKLASLLATRATAMTVTRYARSADRPEHPVLRDTSLQLIGNPWIQRTAWDALVHDEPARQMVEGWLKRRLIKDFFELLAHDGGADLRRLNYWLKWEPMITDMWFVLGVDARSNLSPEFKDLRKRMEGRRRSLDDSNRENNAFVMRIGPLLVIEFGVTGNACYVFSAPDFKADLRKPLLKLNELKQRGGATRLSHMSTWEGRFDYELKKLLGSVPRKAAPLAGQVASPSVPVASVDGTQIPRVGGTSPLAGASREITSSPVDWRRVATDRSSNPGQSGITETQITRLKERCIQQGIEWEDNRSKGGAFWVLMQDRRKHLGFVALLDTYGFSFADKKGFWLKPGK